MPMRPKRAKHGACFCSQVESLIEFYECRGTKLNASPFLSPVTAFDYVHWGSVAVQS